MGESKDDIKAAKSDKVDADGNLTKQFKGDVHAAQFALRLLKAIGKKGILVPDEKVVKTRIKAAAQLLSEYRYTEDASRFDDATLNLTDEEVAAFDGSPERLKLLKRLRHPKIAGKNKAEVAEYAKSKEDLKAFVNSEKVRIANELEGKTIVPSPDDNGTRTQQGDAPKGTQRLALVYQARAAQMAAQLIDEAEKDGDGDQKFAKAQRAVQALLYIDTMGKLARKDKPPQEAPVSDGFVQSALPRDEDEPASDASRKKADDYLEEALARRGEPDAKPVIARAKALSNIARGQLTEADQMTTAASLLSEDNRPDLLALLKPIRQRYDSFATALQLAMDLKLKDDPAEAFAQIDKQEKRLALVQERIQETDADLEKARNFYAENSEIAAELKDLLFKKLVKGKKGKVKMENAALTGSGDIKAKNSALPQGPLKEIVAKYRTVSALEKFADMDRDSRDMVDKMKAEIKTDTDFLNENMDIFEEIEDLIEDYEEELARKRWAYDAQVKSDLERYLDIYRERLNSARDAKFLKERVRDRIDLRLTKIRDTHVPEAGEHRKKAEALQKRLDKFEKKHLKPLGEAMHTYAEGFNLDVKSAKSTVEGYAENRQSASDKKTLASAAKKADKETSYKGKFDIEFQQIRGSLRIEKPDSVKTQTDLLDDLQKRVDAKTAKLNGQKGLTTKAKTYDKDLGKEVALDLAYSEREAGRIATIKPLLKDRIDLVERLISSNKHYAPATDKATFDSLETRLKSVKARMKAAKSSEEYNALWDDLRGIDKERVAARGAGKIDKEADVEKIIEIVSNAQTQMIAALKKFFDDQIAPIGKFASSRTKEFDQIDNDDLEDDISIATMAKYCDPKSPDLKKPVIDKFTQKLPLILEKRDLDKIFTDNSAGFEKTASDADRRAAKETILADLRWRRELIAASAHGKKLRLNPFDGGDQINSFLRVLQAAEGQIMAKIK